MLLPSHPALRVQEDWPVWTLASRLSRFWLVMSEEMPWQELRQQKGRGELTIPHPHRGGVTVTHSPPEGGGIPLQWGPLAPLTGLRLASPWLPVTGFLSLAPSGQGNLMASCPCQTSVVLHSIHTSKGLLLNSIRVKPFEDANSSPWHPHWYSPPASLPSVGSGTYPLATCKATSKPLSFK